MIDPEETYDPPRKSAGSLHFKFGEVKKAEYPGEPAIPLTTESLLQNFHVSPIEDYFVFITEDGEYTIIGENSPIAILPAGDELWFCVKGAVEVHFMDKFKNFGGYIPLKKVEYVHQVQEILQCLTGKKTK